MDAPPFELGSKKTKKQGRLAGATSTPPAETGSRGPFLDHSQGCVEPQGRHNSLRLGSRSSVEEGGRIERVEPLERHLLIDRYSFVPRHEGSGTAKKIKISLPSLVLRRVEPLEQHWSNGSGKKPPKDEGISVSYAIEQIANWGRAGGGIRTGRTTQGLHGA